MGCLYKLAYISICKCMHSYCGHFSIIFKIYHRSHKSIHFVNGLFKTIKRSIKLLEVKAQYYEGVLKKFSQLVCNIRPS